MMMAQRRIGNKNLQCNIDSNGGCHYPAQPTDEHAQGHTCNCGGEGYSGEWPDCETGGGVGSCTYDYATPLTASNWEAIMTLTYAHVIQTRRL